MVPQSSFNIEKIHKNYRLKLSVEQVSFFILFRHKQLSENGMGKNTNIFIKRI